LLQIFPHILLPSGRFFSVSQLGEFWVSGTNFSTVYVSNLPLKRIKSQHHSKCFLKWMAKILKINFTTLEVCLDFLYEEESWILIVYLVILIFRLRQRLLHLYSCCIGNTNS
jgi:hypothetical protein